MTSFKLLVLRTLLVLAGITVISACNTVQGVGKDLQQGGEELQKAATSSKKSV